MIPALEYDELRRDSYLLRLFWSWFARDGYQEEGNS